MLASFWPKLEKPTGGYDVPAGQSTHLSVFRYRKYRYIY